MIWSKPSLQEERRVRDYLATAPSLSETALSLSAKLGISRRRCRALLEQLAREGLVRRRDLADEEPIFYRYPTRERGAATAPGRPRLVWPASGVRAPQRAPGPVGNPVPDATTVASGCPSAAGHPGPADDDQGSAA
jgi:predicted ArsR family transcriptional regulator